MLLKPEMAFRLEFSYSMKDNDDIEMKQTWDGTISVGPPSSAWLNKDSFNSRLWSRSLSPRDSFDLSRSLCKECWIVTWSRTKLDSAMPCCFL